MRKIGLLLIVQLFVFQAFSQEKCLDDEKAVVDLNTINKCEITEPAKGASDKLAEGRDVVVVTKRYLKKREVLMSKEVKESNSLKTKEIVKIAQKGDFLDVEIIKLKQGVFSFDSVDEIPSFQSCVGTSLDKEDCFNYEMQKHIEKTFIYPEKAIKKGIQGDIEVSFIINKEGKIVDVTTSGEKDQELLKKEAKRIVSLLPNFNPGKQKGEKSNVSYTFPMSFTLD